MLGRVVPLVLALVVGVAPVAREICLVACSDAQTGSSAHAHHHAAGSSVRGHVMPGHPMTGHEIETPAAAAHSMPDHHHGAEATAVRQAAREARRGPNPSVFRACCGHEAEPLPASLAAMKVTIDLPAAVLHVEGPANPLAVNIPAVLLESVPRAPVPLALRTPLRV